MNETKREIEAHAAIDAGYEVMTYDTPLDEFPMADNEINGINQIILLVGKRRTGKTYWVRDFMETYKHQLPYVFVFSKTKYNGYWQQYLPEYCIFSEFDEAVVKKILDAQISRIKETGINSAICLLFDDFASDPRLRYAELFNDLCYNGRHRNMTVLFTTQKLTAASVGIRQNADKVVLFYTVDRNVLKVASDTWGGEFRSGEDFRLMLSKNTLDNQSVVIDLKTTTKRGRERYYRYKARDLDGVNFTLGCDAMWQNKRAEMVAKQRKTYHVNKAPLKPSTLIRYKNQSALTAADVDGRTDAMRRFHNQDKTLTKVRGENPRDWF